MHHCAYIHHIHVVTAVIVLATDDESSIDLMHYWKVRNMMEGELLKAGNELEGLIDFIKLSRNFLFKSPLVALKMSPLNVVAGDPLPLHSFIKNVCEATCCEVSV